MAAKRVLSPLTCGAADTAYPVRLALESLGFIVSAALFCTIAGAQHHASGVFFGTLQASDDISPAHHGILFVNNVKPSHFPVQFFLQ